MCIRDSVIIKELHSTLSGQREEISIVYEPDEEAGNLEAALAKSCLLYTSSSRNSKNEILYPEEPFRLQIKD